jgi:hypothetical protein
LASGTSPESLGEFMKNHEFLRILMVINQIFTRPGKRLHNELEHHHAINGQIHYFYGHFLCRKLLVYQRVYGKLWVHRICNGFQWWL